MARGDVGPHDRGETRASLSAELDLDGQRTIAVLLNYDVGKMQATPRPLAAAANGITRPGGVAAIGGAQFALGDYSPLAELPLELDRDLSRAAIVFVGPNVEARRRQGHTGGGEPSPRGRVGAGLGVKDAAMLQELGRHEPAEAAVCVALVHAEANGDLSRLRKPQPADPAHHRDVAIG
ncbi:MAG: hypothetical protein ACRDJ2_06105 [Actinomycetota bacterium]